MYIDANIGGSVDGTGGADLEGLAAQVATAELLGFDGVWSTEVSRDPFLPLMIAAERSRVLQLGTAIAVAFARSPMTMATAANDLNSFSQGRFVLGLGSQIQAHIQRRFGMPWSAPAQRMREYIQALQAIWRCWHAGENLDFRGAHYQHTLMTPMFTPRPNPFGPPRVVVAAVGPHMTTVAAEVADGLLVHGFTTARYLREVTVPLIDAGLRASGRARTDFSITYPGLVATGGDDESLTTAIQLVRDQIAFYGATPAYRKVLDLHGWGDLHLELHRLSKLGQWQAMSGLVDDTVLHTIAVVGSPAEVGADIARRFGGLVDRFTLYTPYLLGDEDVGAVVSAIKQPLVASPSMGQ
ncbi:LLM class F420-dependent oxidoreductase [Mycobacterium sp.]|uniref:LLM class F420-dependent oxidoreductase n=1 Tax=Mycobacterium sp. TaxID=1785 RepID=UPI001219C15A|nr:LLM class F420-dependent oxidoreductase [Mycobacterium sp.]TAM64408.1 MAG: LLM class F420-dependent oxidoreductase [Mycobacterium sp.]